MNIGIGKIVEIRNTKIFVDLFKSIDASFKVKNGVIIRIGGVNNFIKVQDSVYQINLEKIVEANTDEKENLKILPLKKLECELIGYFDKNNNYKIGSNGEMPYLFQNVSTLNTEELLKVYSNTNDVENSIEIGKYLFEPLIPAYININNFFASHILIVGNTGSGKSNTLANLYTLLFEKKYNFRKSKFLIIDTNGEYHNAFTNNKRKNIIKLDLNGDKNELKIPISLITLEDWQILTEASEKTQLPLLRTVYNIIDKKIFSKKEAIAETIHTNLKSVIVKILESNQKAPIKISALLSVRSILEDYDYYNNEINGGNNFNEYIDIIDMAGVNNDRLILGGNIFDDETETLIQRFRDINCNDKYICQFSVEEFLLMLQFEKTNRIYNYNIADSNISPYIARFISNKSKFEKIFTPFLGTGPNKDIEQIIFNDKDISICDVASAGREMKRIVVAFLLRGIYDKAIRNREKQYGKIYNSYHIIIDEAHNYLSPLESGKEDLIYESCLDTIETIIKEGRKNGIFLTISTQRPSDITHTVLSQCHNYVIHKLVNPNDIKIIQNSIPFLDELSVKMLTILSPGQAIFSGTSFDKANIINVSRLKKYYVDSETPNLIKIWGKK